MFKKRYIFSAVFLMSAMLPFSCAVMLTSCEPSETTAAGKRAKSAKARKKKRNLIPRDAYPIFYYQKLGSNWFKLYTGADKRTGYLDYPIMRVEYVKGEKLPIVIEPSSKSKWNHVFSRSYDDYQKQIKKDHRVESYRYYKGGITTLNPKPFYCDRFNHWKAYDAHFEASTERASGCLRSRDPLFFDQHIYVKLGSPGVYFKTAPDPKTGKYVDTVYPYLDWKLEVRLLESEHFKAVLDKNIKRRSREFANAHSQDLRRKIKFLEALVESIYIGPDLPADVRALVESVD